VLRRYSTSATFGTVSSATGITRNPSLRDTRSISTGTSSSGASTGASRPSTLYSRNPTDTYSERAPVSSSELLPSRYAFVARLKSSASSSPARSQPRLISSVIAVASDSRTEPFATSFIVFSFQSTSSSRASTSSPCRSSGMPAFSRSFSSLFRSVRSSSFFFQISRRCSCGASLIFGSGGSPAG